MQYYAKIEGTDSFTNHVSNLKRDSSLSDNALQRLTTHSCETLHTIIRRSNCWCSSSTEPNKTWMTFVHGQFVPFSEHHVKVWMHLFEFFALTQQWIVRGGPFFWWFFPLLLLLLFLNPDVSEILMGNCHCLPSTLYSHLMFLLSVSCHCTVSVASKQLLHRGGGSGECNLQFDSIDNEHISHLDNWDLRIVHFRAHCA